MSLLGKAGPVHGTGTRQYAKPGDVNKAEVATGRASNNHLPEPLPTWMWRDDRACKDKPTVWWYHPEEDEDGNLIASKEDGKRAEKLCAACPVDLVCREYGLRHERHGRWGGLRVEGLNPHQRDDYLAGVERERHRRAQEQRAS